jgi:molybdopterin-guanine dinucleotide biosynthesis protein A
VSRKTAGRPDREEEASFLLREAAAWRLASLLFERPTPVVLCEIAALARETEDTLLSEAAASSAEGTEGLYLALLGPGGPISPREVTYRPLEDPGRVLSDLMAAYEAFAYRPRTEDPIDHAAVEAGFAGYLKMKESYALAKGDAEAAAVTGEAFESFLRDHLAPLAAGIAGRLAGSGTYLERASAALAARTGGGTERFASRPILGGVLIGGESTRMGAPKHLLLLEGRSYLERAVDALRPHVREVVLLGAGEIPSSCESLRRLPDAPGVGGPIAGILAALRSDPGAAWVITSCDTPRLGGRSVEWLLSERRAGRCAVLPRNAAGRTEPLAAVYEPEAAEILERLVREGRAAPSALSGELGVLTPDIPADLEPDFRDVDTPGDQVTIG